jgi:hypothetical protein
MSDEPSVELGFVNEAGETVSFDQIAESLPKEYSSIGDHDLPAHHERADYRVPPARLHRQARERTPNCPPRADCRTYGV